MSEELLMSEELMLENKPSIDFLTKKMAQYEKSGHPAAKHIKKALDNPTNKTNVLKNLIHAHCFDCSHDSADPAGSHPKNCDRKKCPLFNDRPMSGTEKAERKAQKNAGKEVDPKKAEEMKAKRQANAEKARAGRKSFKECLEEMQLDEGAEKVINSKKGKVLMSYDTVVALIKPDGTAFKTADTFSKTTSKHINKFLDGKSAETKPQKWFDNLL